MLDLEVTMGELGYSGAELSRRLGVHENAVRRWRKSGRVPGPVVAYLELVLALSRLGVLGSRRDRGA